MGGFRSHRAITVQEGVYLLKDKLGLPVLIIMIYINAFDRAANALDVISNVHMGFSIIY